MGFGRGYHCVSWVLCDRGVGVLVCSVVVGSVGVGVLLVAVGLVCYGCLLFTISCSMDSFFEPSCAAVSQVMSFVRSLWSLYV